MIEEALYKFFPNKKEKKLEQVKMKVMTGCFKIFLFWPEVL